MQRVLIYSHDDQFLSELVEADVSQLRTHTKLNGEHCLTISTRATLVQGQRILTQDGAGKWYEWVVTTADDEHTWGTYECDWSLQNDLQVTQVSRILTDKTAREAISAALSGTSRWGVGTVNVAGRGSASMYQTDGWSALSTAVETWGGEVDAEITVNRTNVVSRSVSLLSHLGQSDAVRRFDYGHDLRGIRRVVERYPRACRIVPLGKGEETEEGGYGRKITIKSVNDGIEYLQNDDVVELLRLPDGSGGWEYPTIYVENPDIEEPQALLEWGQSVLGYYTMPMVTYEADVMQLAMVGMDVRNISLGDVVQCVDRGFRGEGLRIEGRVVELDVDGIDPSGTVVTIGHIRRSIASELASRVSSIGGVIDTVISTGVLDLSERYVRSMLDRINEEANLTGGYTYITEGQGIRTYDKAVSDPLVGTEASAVCEFKGGTIRIANTKDEQGQWEWKTVFTSGRILAEMIDAIGSSTGSHAQLTTNGLAVYDGATLLSEFAGDHMSILPNFVEAGRSVGDIGYIELVGCSGRIETEIGSTRDIMRVSSFGPLYIQGYDGVYAVNDMNGRTSMDLSALDRICYGSMYQTTNIAAHGYHDFDITFPEEYDSPPNVQLTIYTDTKATTSFDCDIFLRSVSTTGFTARIINREGTGRAPAFHWLAVGQ